MWMHFRKVSADVDKFVYYIYIIINNTLKSHYTCQANCVSRDACQANCVSRDTW